MKQLEMVISTSAVNGSIEGKLRGSVDTDSFCTVVLDSDASNVACVKRWFVRKYRKLVNDGNIEYMAESMSKLTRDNVNARR